jgi:tryptophan-rich sensory protein
MSVLLRFVDALNKDDSQGRWLNIGLAIGGGMFANGLALWLGRGMHSDATPWFALPPWAAALVWVFVLALLGASRWLLNSYTIIGVATARTMVTVLILCCMLWPLYSLPVVDLRIALAGNVATIGLAAATVVMVRRRSIEAASLVTPLIVWLAFATIVVLAAMGQL